MTTAPTNPLAYELFDVTTTRIALTDLLKKGVGSLYHCVRGHQLAQPPVDPTSEGAQNLVATYLKEAARDVREPHYAELIEPVAVSMLALASLDPEETPLPRVYHRKSSDVLAAMTESQASLSFVLRLDGLPHQRVRDLPSAEAFGHRSMLHLQALVLNYNRHRPERTTLCIVLPDPWQFNEVSGHRDDEGMRILKVDRYGRVSFNRLHPTKPDPTFVAKALCLHGHKWTESSNNSMVGSRCTDEAFGFPGARDYFARWLPQLGPYLLGMFEAEQAKLNRGSQQ